MSTPSFRDIELLSAYLDRELSQKEKTRLVARIVKEPELARALEDMRQTRSMLRQTPHRKAPRNFTLTPKMAGIRPPVPRVVPALSWASAVAMLLFICTLGYNFLTVGGSLSAAAPRAADNYGSHPVSPGYRRTCFYRSRYCRTCHSRSSHHGAGPGSEPAGSRG